MDRPNQAMGEMSGTGERNPKAAEAEYERGLALAKQMNHPEAIAAFAEAIALDGAYAPAHLEKAKSHLSFDGDLDAIRENLANALILEPEVWEAHARFAQYLGQKGDAEGAVLHYECALSLDANLNGLRVDYATQLVGSGKLNKAESQLRALLDEKPENDFRIRTLLASTLQAQGKTQAAAEELAKAAEETRSAVLYRRAADLYDAAEDPARADQLRSEADGIDPPPERRKMRPLVKAKPPPKKKRRRKR